MISRTAFAQLHHSALLLAGTILGMAIVYLAPPLLLFTRNPLAAYFRTGRLDSDDSRVRARRCASTVDPPSWAPLLPLIALFYLSATVHSAIAYWTGRGGMWKDRVQDVR